MMSILDKLQGNISNRELSKFRDQNYDDIKKECLDSGEYWTDPLFGPEDTSLWEGEAKKEVEWIRIKDIDEGATLYVNGGCEDDVRQGAMGNCWFVAAVACFGIHKKLLDNVIPEPKKQDPLESADDYCGMFLFRFYRFGEWVEVVIDDWLPTRHGKLVFMHSTEKNEFWCALLEKAYAKLAGSYEALDAGRPADALTDLTGGVSQFTDFTKANIRDDEIAREKLFQDLLKALSRDSLVNCSMIVDESENMESMRESGLIVGHAYTLIKCYELSLGFLGLQGRHRLVKLRNPWGGTEWKGAWSDDDPRWAEISESKKKEMDFTNEDDGEFWMEYEELIKNFDNVTICRIINTDINLIRKRWYLKEIRGKWTPGENAGGCANFKETFYTNPQIQFKILEEDDETVQIVLAQRDLRIDDLDNHVIGFRIFKVADNNSEKIVRRGGKAVEKAAYSNVREIYHRCRLEIGTYVIIPTTYEPDVEADYLLRIFTEDDAYVEVLE